MSELILGCVKRVNFSILSANFRLAIGYYNMRFETEKIRK